MMLLSIGWIGNQNGTRGSNDLRAARRARSREDRRNINEAEGLRVTCAAPLVDVPRARRSALRCGRPLSGMRCIAHTDTHETMQRRRLGRGRFSGRGGGKWQVTSNIQADERPAGAAQAVAAYWPKVAGVAVRDPPEPRRPCRVAASRERPCLGSQDQGARPIGQRGKRGRGVARPAGQSDGTPGRAKQACEFLSVEGGKAGCSGGTGEYTKGKKVGSGSLRAWPGRGSVVATNPSWPASAGRREEEEQDVRARPAQEKSIVR